MGEWRMSARDYRDKEESNNPVISLGIYLTRIER